MLRLTEKIPHGLPLKQFFLTDIHLGHSYFSADSNVIHPTQEKKYNFPFIFLLPPDSAIPHGISLEIMVPQKWFTYQNLQNLTRKMVRLLSK